MDDEGLTLGITEQPGPEGPEPAAPAEPPSGAAPPVEAETDAGEPTAPAADEGAEEPQPQEPPAQEQLPAQLRKLIAELQADHPESAQVLKRARDAYFQAETYKREVGTIEQARNLRATFESLGSEEGIQELQDSAETLRQIDEQGAAGDPGLIDAMASESPEGFKKLVPVALDRLARMDPAAYENALRPAIAQVLSNLGERLAEAVEWIRAEQPQFASRTLERILGFITEQNRLAQQAQAEPASADSSRFREREAQVAEREQRIFVRDIGQQVRPYIRQKVETALRQQLASGRLSSEAKDSLFNEVLSQFDQLPDREMRRWRALVEAGDAPRAVSFVRLRADSMAERLAKEVWKTRYGGSAQPAAESAAPRPRPATPQPPGAAGTAANPILVPRRPPSEEIDRTLPGWQTSLIAGSARLKSSGKFVRWRKGA